MAGVVMEVRTKMTARGKIAFVLIDDGSQPREVSVFSELFDRERDRIVVDELLVADVKVGNDDFSGGLRIVAERLMSLGEARARFACGLQIRLNGETAGDAGAAADVERLQGLLAPFRDGECPVSVCYRNSDAEAELPLGGDWKVRPEEALIEGLRDWLEPAAVELVYGA